MSTTKLYTEKTSPPVKMSTDFVRTRPFSQLGPSQFQDRAQYSTCTYLLIHHSVPPVLITSTDTRSHYNKAVLLVLLSNIFTCVCVQCSEISL